MSASNAIESNIKETTIGQHKISKEDVQFVCLISDDDDDCEAVIMKNYNVSENVAWDIIDNLWDTYGRN
jgi:hypothetical protein